MTDVPTVTPLRRRAQYSLRALLVLVTAVSIPLGFWASREHAYRALVANVTPLVNHQHVCVEKAGRGAESLRRITGVDELKRDDVVVGAYCHTFEKKEVAAVLALATLKELDLTDLGPQVIAAPPGTLEKLGKARPDDRAIEIGSAIYSGDESPLGAIDPLLREIASKLPSLQKLDLVATSVSGDGLRHLTTLRSLRWLDLTRTRVSDDDLACIPAMPALEELILDDTGPNRYVRLERQDRAELARVRATSYGRELTSGHEITDEGLHHLAGASRLRVLSLREAKVTGVGFRHLASLTRLEEIRLPCTDFDDEGAKCLAALPSIRILNLSETKITSAALVDISTMSRLWTLSLEATAVDDASLLHLARLPSLSRLNLRATRITDAGLMHLAALPSLERVELYGVESITAAGVARLQSLRPELRISRSGSSITDPRAP